jgi:branched-chain amino acid transport system ATP-binding protein
MALLDVVDVSAGYGAGLILHSISFSVRQGEAVVILGANGAGKTTTLRAVSGMIHANGEIVFDGRKILGRRPEQVAAAGIAHVPQGRGTILDLNVEDNLRVGAYPRRDGDVDSDMADWYEVFPRLGQRREQLAAGLSGGEQQMLAIARALMGRPKLVLLDEPSLGLAPIVTEDLFRTLGRLNVERGVSMLIVEQNVGLALDLADRGYVLETGRIVVEGSADDLAQNEDVQRAYLGV